MNRIYAGNNSQYGELSKISSEAITELSSYKLSASVNHKSGRPDCLATLTLAKILDHFSQISDSKPSNGSFPYHQLDILFSRQLGYRSESAKLSGVLKTMSRALREVEAASPKQLDDLIRLCLDLEQVFSGRPLQIIHQYVSPALTPERKSAMNKLERRLYK